MVRKKKKINKIISWIVLLALAVGAGAVGYFVWDAYFKDKGDAESKTPESSELVEASEEVNTAESEDWCGKDEIAQYDGEDPNSSDEITGVITYAGVVDDGLIIRMNLDQFLQWGDCMLLLETAGNVVYSNTAGIDTAATTSTCAGFNVPTDLLEPGHYNITVEIESDGKKGTLNGEVDI